jgi:ribosome-associated protein
MTQETIHVELTHSPTELYKILKFEGLVASGAEAKQVIADGFVILNGQVETQKRKKIVEGDEIQFEHYTLLISLA